MAISSMDQLVAAMTASTAQNITFNKTSSATEGSGTFFDLCQTAGIPGAMATPDAASSGGTSYTGSSAGGLAFTAPSAGQSTYLASFSVTGTVPGNFYLIDRLWACRGLSGTASATTSVTGMSNITRYSSGVGCEIWYWCITAPSGGGSGTMTVSYTNSDGVSGRTCTIVIGAGTPPPSTGQCVVGSLQAGDKGVQSIQSVTNTSVSFTGGSHGLFVARRLVTAPIASPSVGASLDGLRTGLQQVDTNACLNFLLLCSNTTTGYWVGNINLVQG